MGLGPQSSKQATNIRKSNPSSPSGALEKIWERSDERYGSPELIDSILKEKIQKFPRVTLPKDKQKIYELSDILSEIESVKSDP